MSEHAPGEPADREAAAPRPSLARRALVLLSRPAAQLAVLLAASAALHAWHLACAVRDPYLQQRVVDEVYFHAWGRAVAEGRLVGDLPFFTSPLFAYWLGLLYTLAGDSVAVVLAANAVLGVATVALTWDAARRTVGPRAALAAGILLVGCRAPVFYAGLPEKSALVLFLAAACVDAFAWAEGRGGRRRMAVAGAVAGLAALAHPLLLVAVPAAALHLVLARRARPALLGAVLYLAGALAAVLPATVHNYARSGEVILVCWNGGAALYAGNERWNTSGMYAPPPFSTATIQSEITDYWREAERRTGRPLSPAESSAFWTREALREMAEVPARSAARVARRLRWAFGDYELQDSRTYAFYAERLPSLGGPRWGFGALAVVGLLGAMVSLRDRRATFLIAFAAAYAGALAVFFVYGRYRLPLAVPLAVLGGALAERVAGWIRARRLAPVGACAAIAAGLAAMLFAAPFAHRESFFPDYNNLAVAYQEQGRIEEALVEFEKAVTIRPGDDPGVSAIATELAMLFWRRGERDRARALLREVLRARPADQDVAAVLATLERL